jgi:predicted HTH transcriptional regulator
MAEPSKTTANQQSLRKATIVYPQPIAIAAGQVLRSWSPQERVDACLKAGEVITRYVAAVALAAFRARDADANTEEQVIEPLAGPLSFGHFLGLIQKIAGLQSNHPLAPYLSPFRKKRRGDRGVADDGLVALLELRNGLGHDLARLSEARARSILAEHDPESRLVQVLDSLEGMLSCPLFLIEDQRLERGQILARWLWLMGDSKDPEPEELVLKQGIHYTRQPYIAIDNRVLRLWPWVVWDILPQQQCYGLLLIDTVKDDRVLYQSLDAIEQDSNGEAVAALQATSTGQQAPAELIETHETNNLAKLWREEKHLRLEAAQRLEGRMPWDDFDQETAGWYATHLAGGPVESPSAVIQERLFDNHERFLEREITQALLLFGKTDVVRRVLKREMVDLRTYSGGATRWGERDPKCANILVCLRAAVDFFARHIGMQDITMNQLANTTGTADYLAMREALVNLFIHQDYGDPSAAAQVELRAERAAFFNTGFSLVAKERLVEGGKSQARNPLIARALRLIGFAELAGSGIRALQTAWREARRRPPQFESDREANTFTVTLDWRLVSDTYDAVWKQRLGVRLTTEQAQILNLALDTEGITIEEAASGTGLTIDDTREALNYLQLQVLIEERQGRFYVKEHLKELGR